PPNRVCATPGATLGLLLVPPGKRLPTFRNFREEALPGRIFALLDSPHFSRPGHERRRGWFDRQRPNPRKSFRNNREPAIRARRLLRQSSRRRTYSAPPSHRFLLDVEPGSKR